MGDREHGATAALVDQQPVVVAMAMAMAIGGGGAGIRQRGWWWWLLPCTSSIPRGRRCTCGTMSLIMRGLLIVKVS